MVRELDATNAVKTAGWASTQDFVTSVAGGTKAPGPRRSTGRPRPQPLLAPVGEAMADGWLSAAKAHVIHRAVENLPGNPEVRARGVQALLAKPRPRRHRAPQGRPTGSPRSWTPTGRTAETRKPWTGSNSRPPRPVPDHHRRPRRRRLDPRTLLHRGRRPDQDHPDVAGRTQTQHPTGLRPHHLRGPRLRSRRPRPTRPRHPDARRTRRGLPPTPDRRPPPRIPRRHPPTHPDDDPPGPPNLDRVRDHRDRGTALRQHHPADLLRRRRHPHHPWHHTEVLDVGRNQRLVTAAIWKALVARDRHCRFPDCTRPPLMCHAHHLQHWVDGGATSLANMILLCGHHHRLIHAGPWHIHTTGPAEFDFEPPPGTRRARTHRSTTTGRTDACSSSAALGLV